MRVLVATDASTGADVALAEAAALASAPNDVLAVVHVLPPLRPIAVLFPQQHAPDALNAAALTLRAAEAVRARVKRVTSREVEVFVEEGTDYAQIVQRAEAWHADIVVVGSHGQSGIARVLGGVAEKVLRYAPSRVLVARAPRSRGWVLAATDLSEPSLPAVTEGAEEARRRGARLKVVHATGFLDVEASYLLELGTPSISNVKSEDDSAGRMLSEAVARLGVEAECAILYGSPAAAVIREAEALDAELVVVGTRGRTGLARLALGSVAEKIVRGAPCSVLAVRLAATATS